MLWFLRLNEYIMYIRLSLRGLKTDKGPHCKSLDKEVKTAGSVWPSRHHNLFSALA